MRNGQCPEKAGSARRIARAKSAGLQLELPPERAETPPEVTESGRAEGNRTRDFFLGTGQDMVFQAILPFAVHVSAPRT